MRKCYTVDVLFRGTQLQGLELFVILHPLKNDIDIQRSCKQTLPSGQVLED